MICHRYGAGDFGATRTGCEMVTDNPGFRGPLPGPRPRACGDAWPRQAGGQPFASPGHRRRVDHDLSPILLLRPRCRAYPPSARPTALRAAVRRPGGRWRNPQTAPRVTLTGLAPGAGAEDAGAEGALSGASIPMRALYADFGDFRFSGSPSARASGRRLRPDPLARGRPSCCPTRPLAAAWPRPSADIVGHMNDDHADAVQLYAGSCRRWPGAWRMAGDRRRGHRSGAGGAGARA